MEHTYHLLFGHIEARIAVAGSKDRSTLDGSQDPIRRRAQLYSYKALRPKGNLRGAAEGSRKSRTRDSKPRFLIFRDHCHVF